MQLIKEVEKIIENKNDRPAVISMIEDVVDIRENVSKFIELHDEFELSETFGSIESFLQYSEVHPGYRCDILLLDIGLPGLSGIEGIPLIIDKIKDIDIVMLTTYEEEDIILQSICAGACSYISKKSSLTQIVDAIRIVKMGGSYMSPSIAREIVSYLKVGQPAVVEENSLTDRQNEILKALAEGKTYKVISKELFISVETVRSHIKKLYKHLQVKNKAEAIAMYLQGKVK